MFDKDSKKLKKVYEDIRGPGIAKHVWSKSTPETANSDYDQLMAQIADIGYSFAERIQSLIKTVMLEPDNTITSKNHQGALMDARNEVVQILNAELGFNAAYPPSNPKDDPNYQGG